MWKVIRPIFVDDPVFGCRPDCIVEFEGSPESCKFFSLEHPGTYVSRYCC